MEDPEEEVKARYGMEDRKVKKNPGFLPEDVLYYKYLQYPG